MINNRSYSENIPQTLQPSLDASESSTAAGSGPTLGISRYPQGSSSLSYSDQYSYPSSSSDYLADQYYRQSSELKRSPDFIHSTLEVDIMFTGDYVNKLPIKLDTRMILPKQSMLYYSKKIYFSPVIKYTDKLFRDANVPQKLTSFIDQNTFRKLLIAGAKSQDIPKYESNKSVDITNSNIEFMVKILFKGGNSINIPIDRFQDRKFKIRNLGSVTQFKKTEKNQMKKDKPIRIKIEISVIEAMKYKEMTASDFTRLECKDKKEDLIEHLYEIANKIPGITLKREKPIPKKMVILPSLYGNTDTSQNYYRNLNPYNRENQYAMNYRPASSYHSQYSDYKTIPSYPSTRSYSDASSEPYRRYSGGKRRHKKKFAKTKKIIAYNKKRGTTRKKYHRVIKKRKYTRRKTT